MKYDMETGALTPQRRLDEQREVYFIRAEKLDLIKIGVANDAMPRLRGLSNDCPDRLVVLGVQRCARFGKTEEELHAMFARDRFRGEWFIPTKRILDYIAAHAWNPVRMKVLQAHLDRPTMPRGRPKKNAEGTASAKPAKNRLVESLRLECEASANTVL